MNHEFCLSDVLEHNRELVRRGVADPVYVNELNDWYIRVASLSESSGRSFDEIAPWIPAPLKAFTSADGTTQVNAPSYFVLRPDGAEIVFNSEQTT